ncbi:hypothetical protein CHS0354_019132 [Potamilus streckersoni]|uniref:Uncharacterized protein n=1 Tax=Potamilus streckersoni TaxID=2493646 RepID=A0AAE0W3W6_9BIVA|nr:hypothetical protein CHS0354_019132 [Potamilus streckersoni]
MDAKMDRCIHKEITTIFFKTMSFSNTFFPRNLEKKTILAECGKLKFLLRDCFTSVNHLIGRIEENIPGQKLERIYVQTSARLGDNCIIIIERINQIKKLLEEKEFDVEKPMDTNMFKELKVLSTHFEAIIKTSTIKIKVIAMFGFAIGFVLLTILSMTGHGLEGFGMIGTIVIVTIIEAVLGVGINIVYSVIYGTLEMMNLDLALQDYEWAVEDFKPIVSTFCRNIYKVTEMIQVRKKK